MKPSRMQFSLTNNKNKVAHANHIHQMNIEINFYVTLRKYLKEYNLLRFYDV